MLRTVKPLRVGKRRSLLRRKCRTTVRKLRLDSSASSPAPTGVDPNPEYTLFQFANDPMLVLDLQGRYIEANEAACRHLGYSRAELLNMTALQINNIAPEAWPDAMAPILKLGSRIGETVHHRKDGTTIPVEVSMRLIMYRGQPALVSIVRRIESRKRLEAELVRRNLELAKQLLEMTLPGETSTILHQSDRPVVATAPTTAGAEANLPLDQIRALAVAQERRRLGRELHDHLGQSLASAAAYTAVALESLHDDHVDDARWAINLASKALQQAYGDLREAIQGVRGSCNSAEEWTVTFQQYVARYEKEWGIHCEPHCDDEALAACDALSRMELMRILQEALTNVRKHAHTRWVGVTLALVDGHVQAEVVDHGRGFSLDDLPPGHYGLATMRERARGLGGDLTVESNDAGTRLSIRVPARG